ncbi:concanavalin A-like lectin/glucanase [Bimuria novae-zelandiae CBS 107.79]|uniref:Concanavalin A-like lectin/glucanase n=1 Tax=Bimuria novae-zelandiae CBS 107.79 TaxID=1447943 RepID=A0A6A5VSS9_9PLEO|nr:concanavalin A-like lectin/glucanase [Bimuria novae-zelandiae CBS 107.79]
MFKLREAVGALPWLILAMSRFANADCECGYSLNSTTGATYQVFTDLMENDFLHTSGDNATEFGWQPQEYNVSAKDARGPYGKEFDVANVELNPLKDSSAWSGDSENGGDAGLKLWVRGDHSHGFVGSAEVATVRDDAFYGSFRVGMKLSAQNGTCGAFFWFYNNSQEIDMEFLSKQFNESQGAVQLVLQSPESVRNGYDASGTAGYSIQHLPFRPDEQFHEYRFDWTSDSVVFYVDGEVKHTMTDAIPSSSGRLFLNHWSNGDPKWSAGPPGEDTAMTVLYAKAYFNSTDDARKKNYSERCPTFDPAKVCAIPEQTVAPNGNNAKTYFFSQDGGAKTPGQEIYHTTNGNGAGRLLRVQTIYIWILVSFLSWALL